MPIALLLRHGRSTANAEGVLAGRSPGNDLDETGRAQAARVGARLRDVPLTVVVSSPLPRCQQTAQAVVEAHDPPLTLHTDDGLTECGYGGWTGRKLADLAKEPLWQTVQEQPSQVTFPPHEDHAAESMTQMAQRAVATVARWDEQIGVKHGRAAIWVAVTHGDVIKAVIAHALGTDLDRFQRIVVDPGSLSIIRYGARWPFVLRVNDTGGEPVDLGKVVVAATPAAEGEPGAGDAVVGGGDGAP